MLLLKSFLFFNTMRLKATRDTLAKKEIIMAETQNQSVIDTLRDEINTLRAQLDSIIKTGESRKTELKDDLVDKLTRELEHLRHNAMAHAHKAYARGQEGMDEVGEHVRNNPLASLLLAFGAGCIVSCIFRHMR